jgi:hypothetical protein
MGAYDTVIIVPAAKPDTSIEQWAPGGDVHHQLLNVISTLPEEYRVTHIAIQQGETDLNRGTAHDAYLASYGNLIAFLRTRTQAPIYVTIETGYCDPRGLAVPATNHIQAAQRALIDPTAGILAGPDMDRGLDSWADRYDGCHMSGTGARKLAHGWARAFTIYSAVPEDRDTASGSQPN